MRLVSSLLALLMLLPSPAVAREAEGSDVWNGAEISWLDVPTGIKEATVTKKPVLMVLHATWCPACKRYREVFKSRDVVDVSKKFIMILVDIDKYPDINGGFAPDGTYIPRTLFLDAEGNVSSKYVGKDPKYLHSIDLNDPAELLGLMRAAAEVASPPAPTQAAQ